MNKGSILIFIGISVILTATIVDILSSFYLAEKYSKLLQNKSITYIRRFVKEILGYSLVIIGLWKWISYFIEHSKLESTSATDKHIHDIQLEDKTHNLAQAILALEESETKFKEIAANIPGLLFQLRKNKDGFLDISYISEGVYDFIGIHPEEVIKDSNALISLIHPDDKDAFNQTIAEAEKNLKPWKMRFRMQSKNETPVWVRATARPYLVSEGYYIWNGVAIDITEQILAEESLQYRLHVEELITSISAYLINVTIDNIDNSLIKSLRDMGEFLNIERCCLLLFDEAEQSLVKTHEWVSESLKLKPNKDISLTDIPWINEYIRQKEMIFIPKVSELSHQASEEKKQLVSLGVHSLVAVPLVYESSYLGYLSCESYDESKKWRQDDVVLLKMVGRIIVNTLEKIQAEKALRESEDRYRLLVDLSPDIIIVCSYDEIVFINTAGMKLLKASDSYGVIGLSIYDLIKPTDKSNIKTWIDSLYEGKEQPSFVEEKILCLDGTVINSELTGVIFNYNNKKAVLIQIRDITEQKKGREALEESEGKYRTLVENIQNGLYVIHDRVIQYANDAFCTMLGYSHEEVIGKDFLYFTAPKDKDLDLEIYYRKLAGDETIREYEKLLVHKNGKTEILVNTTIGSTQFHGEPIVISTLKDITVKKRMEEALKESEELFRQMFETHKAIKLLVDPKSEAIVNANRSACKFYGYSKEEMQRKKISEINISESQLLSEDLKASLESRDKHPFFRHRLSTGEIRDVEVHSIPIEFKGQKLIYSIIHDVTERKKAEAKLKKYTAELHIAKNLMENRAGELALLNEKLLTSENELRELNDSKDIFFSIISHDLKSPFNPLIGFTELCLNKFDTLSKDKLRDYIEKINKSAKNLYNLVENLLQWSRIQTGRLDYYPSTFEFTALVRDNVNFLQENATRKRITILFDFSETTFVNADPYMTSSIIRNLLSNAIKFTESDGQIIISSQMNKNEILECAISDTGIGMNEEELEKLFRIDKKQSKTGTDDEKGTGLGLILCKEFVEINGGKIWVESEPDKGTTFYFTLQKVK